MLLMEQLKVVVREMPTQQAQSKAQQAQALRQSMTVNNHLSKASKALSEQFKARKAG